MEKVNSTGECEATDERVGQLIRRLRNERGLSLGTLATRSGLSPSFVSQVELGHASPSIASLARMVGILGLTLGDFFQQMSNGAPHIVRVGDRVEVKSVWSQAKAESLSRAAPTDRLEAIQMTLLPGGRSAEQPVALEAEQFVLLLQGTLDLHVEDDVSRIESGDAVTLPADTDFMWKNPYPTEAHVLIVTARNPA